MPQQFLRLLSGLIIVTASANLLAAGAPVYNESALMRGVALPSMHGGTAEGWSLQIDLTNDFVLSANASESIRLDGESTVLRVNWRKRLSPQWDLGVVLPLVVQGGGFMDGFISDWHAFFGLPNAGRERRPDNEFVYQYQRDGQTLMNQRAGEDGIADAMVWLGRDLGWASAKLALKLPTGDEDALLGSGEPGLAAWLENPWQQGDWYGHVAAGLSWSKAGGALATMRRETLPILSASLGWRWSRNLSFMGQIDGHGQAFNGSRLDPLNRPGVQLALGGSFRVADTEFQMLFQEDIVTASSPDFSLHLSWQAAR